MSNWFEKTISLVSPTWALSREQARKHAEFIRSYDAAKNGRRNAGWRPSGTSQNAETLNAASALRNRSRDLCRNNPLVKRAVQSIANNTVGKGVRAKIDGSAKINKLWKDWFETSKCDFDEHLNGYGIQKLVLRAVVESGDALIVRRVNKNNPTIPFELQVLEIDFLDINKTTTRPNKNGSYTFMGIEFNSKGKKTGYWLYEKHPGEVMSFASLKSKFVPAKDVIHVFEKLRPGQVLGVPFGVSAFMRAKDTDEYNDAQVVRQKIAACYTVGITTNDGALSDQSNIDEFERVEPGMIMRLNQGESIEFAQPPTTENFGEFNRTLTQHIAAGFGTTYENMTGDLSKVNFSSGRMGWIEHHRNVEDWQQNILITQFCSKVFDWFLEGARLSGGLSARSNPSVGWTPPGREMIDPSKEVKGIQAMIRNMLISPTDAIRRAGYDPDEVLAETVEWNEKMDEAEVVSDADPRQGKGEEPDGRGRPSTTGENTDDDVDEK